MSLRVLALALLCCAGLCLAAQPSLVTPADHKAQRLGLELETKHIYNDAKKSTSADTIYLVSLGAEDKLNGITQKHAWLTPADGRDSKSANPGPYTAAAIGAFTGEIDSYKGKGNDRCGLLEFVYRPMESITNADSVKRVMKVASLWEKSMIAPCVDPTLAPTARKREIICGGNTPSAPPSDDKGTLVYPAKVALDAFNAALGQELAAYTLKLESEAYHLVCPDMKFTGGVKKIKPEQPDDSELVKQIRATAVKHNQNIQDITKYSLDIYIHVNTYTAVSSLADGKYDLLFPEEADGARNTLKTCRETANEIAKTNKFPQYAPTLILACWAIAGELEWRGLPQKVRDSAGGGGAKDIFVVMPKISVTALARAVLSEEESTAFFNYIKVTDLKNLAATFHEKLVTANILKVGDLGNFKTKFANILREVKTPFPQELESTQYGYGKVDTSDTAPYDDYGLATVNGVPVFVAELRKPDKHPVFGNVLPRKFNTNVDKVAGDMNTLLQELVAGPPKPEPEKKKNPKLGRAKSLPSLLPSQKK